MTVQSRVKKMGQIQGETSISNNFPRLMTRIGPGQPLACLGGHGAMSGGAKRLSAGLIAHMQYVGGRRSWMYETTLAAALESE